MASIRFSRKCISKPSAYTEVAQAQHDLGVMAEAPQTFEPSGNVAFYRGPKPIGGLVLALAEDSDNEGGRNDVRLWRLHLTIQPDGRVPNRVDNLIRIREAEV